MRWTTLVVAVTFGTLLPAATGAQPPGNRKAAAVAKRVAEMHDRLTDATFAASMDAKGDALLTVRARDFLLEKILASSGAATVRLTQGKDVVTIALNQSGYEVARGTRSARFDPRTPQADDRDAIRSVLLGLPPAVRTFRRLSAAIENRDDGPNESPQMVSLLLDGALVQMLDGDAGATERIGKRISRARRAAMKPVKFRPDDIMFDCVGAYEGALLQNSDFLSTCLAAAWSAPWWRAQWAEDFCEWEWLFRSQQYIWQFLGCMTIPV